MQGLCFVVGHHCGEQLFQHIVTIGEDSEGSLWIKQTACVSMQVTFIVQATIGENRLSVQVTFGGNPVLVQFTIGGINRLCFS